MTLLSCPGLSVQGLLCSAEPCRRQRFLEFPQIFELNCIKIFPNSIKHRHNQTLPMLNFNTPETARVFVIMPSQHLSVREPRITHFPGCKESYPEKMHRLPCATAYPNEDFFPPQYFATNHFRNKLDIEIDLTAFIQ